MALIGSRSVLLIQKLKFPLQSNLTPSRIVIYFVPSLVCPTTSLSVLIADAIAGDSERFDVFAKINHWKLPGGKLFANPALALGMLYFRLKEIL